jgi:hypothetical protein
MRRPVHALVCLTLSLKRCAQAPIGKLAFVPARLEHTNELLVLLGDNYFVERSATQTRGIIERRLEGVLCRLCAVECFVGCLCSRAQLDHPARATLSTVTLMQPSCVAAHGPRSGQGEHPHTATGDRRVWDAQDHGGQDPAHGGCRGHPGGYLRGR